MALFPPVYLEGQGPETVTEVGIGVLYDEHIDAGVVRGMLGQRAMDFLNVGNLNTVASVEEFLLKEVPQVEDLVIATKEFWGMKQPIEDYKDVKPAYNGRFVHFGINDGEIGDHTDAQQLGRGTLPGPLTLSIVTKGSGYFMAEKPFRPSYTSDGNRRRRYWDYASKSGTPKLPLRSLIYMEAGDGVFITNHPFQTLHEVRIKNKICGRTAHVFDQWLMSD